MQNHSGHFWGLVAVSGALTLSGCASIISGRSSEVVVDNSGGPTCFSVYDRNHQLVQSGVTPQKIKLKTSEGPFRPAEYTVAFAGHEGVQQQPLTPELNWWTAGNLVIGGIPGIVIDAATGALWKLDKTATGQISADQIVSNQQQGQRILAGGSENDPGPAGQHHSVHPASFREATR